jgi:hypothetical protein
LSLAIDPVAVATVRKAEAVPAPTPSRLGCSVAVPSRTVGGGGGGGGGGGAAAPVSVTGMLRGEPPAPPPSTVTVAL